MDIIKAHEILENRQRKMTRCRKFFDNETIEVNGLAIIALEKQISKKVDGDKVKVKALDVETEQILTYSCLPCPSCEKWITENNKYCPHCGQRIDWDAQ
jgi:hypothetical protein